MKVKLVRPALVRVRAPFVTLTFLRWSVSFRPPGWSVLALPWKVTTRTEARWPTVSLAWIGNGIIRLAWQVSRLPGFRGAVEAP
jgi:hypothetical protein